MKASKTSSNVVTSLEKWERKHFDLRNSFEENEIIVDSLFTQDYGFNAPTAASAVIFGRT